MSNDSIVAREASDLLGYSHIRRLRPNVHKVSRRVGCSELPISDSLPIYSIGADKCSYVKNNKTTCHRQFRADSQSIECSVYLSKKESETRAAMLLCLRRQPPLLTR